MTFIFLLYINIRRISRVTTQVRIYFLLVVLQGLEPQPPRPKLDVLPLHHRTVFIL